MLVAIAPRRLPPQGMTVSCSTTSYLVIANSSAGDHLIGGDVRDASALDAVFSEYRFDAVIHFAALAYVGESVTAPGRYYDVNVHGTRTLLDAMVRAGVRSIIFSSSCAIYGDPDRMPISEHTVPNPINPYGFSKLVCEHMMDDFGRAHGIKSVRLRYFNAAGADPTAEIGEDHDPETLFRSSLMRLRAREPMSRCLELIIRRRMARPSVTIFT
jgi:UDP-glucose 4-epimerase